MKKYERWTDDDVVLLKQMYAAGSNANTIARKLRRTPASVRNKRYALAKQGDPRQQDLPLTVKSRGGDPVSMRGLRDEASLLYGRVEQLRGEMHTHIERLESLLDSLQAAVE